MQSHTFAGSSARALMAGVEVLRMLPLYFGSIKKMGDKMNQDPEECPEWAQLVCGTWVKPKHWEWSQSEWAFRCMMCGKVAKNSGHVESDAHVKNLRNWRYSCRKRSAKSPRVVSIRLSE